MRPACLHSLIKATDRLEFPHRALFFLDFVSLARFIEGERTVFRLKPERRQLFPCWELESPKLVARNSAGWLEQFSGFEKPET
jgi:hypothetical protein